MVSRRIPHDVKVMHGRAKDSLVHLIGIGDRLTQRSRSLSGKHLGDNTERCDLHRYPNRHIAYRFGRVVRRQKILTGTPQLGAKTIEHLDASVDVAKMTGIQMSLRSRTMTNLVGQPGSDGNLDALDRGKDELPQNLIEAVDPENIVE